MTIQQFLMSRKFFLFLLVSFVLYGNTLRNDYAMDDQFVTETSISTKGFSAVKEIFTSYYAEDGKSVYEYRPVVKLSFALEHQLFGVRPWVSHLVNLMLYALCVFLLYKVLLLIFHTQTAFFSLCISLVFACLPVHTEVVASLKNRDVLLCFICCMSIMLQADAFFRSNNYLHVLYATLFAFAGFLTKIELLPYLILTPLVFYKKYRFGIKVLPLIITSVIFVAGYFGAQAIKHQLLDAALDVRHYNYTENPLFTESSFIFRISAAFNVLGHYLKMLMLPTNMVCYYGYNTLPVTDMFSAYALVGMLLSGGIIFFFFKLFKTESPFWYAIIFFAIPVSMFLNVLKIVPGIVAERFMFSASIGFSILLVHLCYLYFNKTNATTLKGLSPAFKMIFAGIFLLNTAFTISRNSEWKNRITLYEHDIKKRPESVPLNMLYSMEILSNINRPNYFLTDRNKMSYVTKAESSLQMILKTDPENVTAFHNLGFIRHNLYQDYTGAIPYYEKALNYDPEKFESQFNLAYCYYQTGRGADAEKLVLTIYPQHSDNQQVLDLINYILIENKKSHEGIILFDELAKKHPENSNIRIILGNFYLALSDTLNAKNAYSKALQIDPNNDQLFKIVNRLSK